MRKKIMYTFIIAILLTSFVRSTPMAAAALPLEQIDVTTWLPITIVIILLVVAVAAIVYMLGGVIQSPNARAWSQVQIYEALITLVIILIIGAVSYIFFIDPRLAFQTVNILPASCSGNNVNNIATLAACDMSAFDDASFSMATLLYMTTFTVGLIPGISIVITPIPTDSGLSAEFGVPSLFTASGTILLGYAYAGFLFMMVLNQLQQLLLSGSILFLTFFLILGLVARTFGITRSFGGAMIALGLALGVVYPFLVSLTYGFIMQSISATLLQIFTPGYLSALFGFIFNPALFTIFSAGSPISLFLIVIGYIVAGLTFIPFLNFIILETFVADLSRALGQQVSFMGLFAGFI